MGAAQCACRRSKRSRGRHSAVSPALSGQMTTLRLEARGRQQGEVLFEGYNSILRGELSLHPSRGPLPRTPRHRLATSPAYHSDCQTVPPHRPPLPSDPDSSPTTPPFTIAPSALLAGKAPCTSTFTPAAGECRDPPAHCGPMLSAEEGPCIGTFTPAGVSMAHLATIKSSRVLTPGRACVLGRAIGRLQAVVEAHLLLRDARFWRIWLGLGLGLGQGQGLGSGPGLGFKG